MGARAPEGSGTGADGTSGADGPLQASDYAGTTAKANEEGARIDSSSEDSDEDLDLGFGAGALDANNWPDDEEETEVCHTHLTDATHSCTILPRPFQPHFLFSFFAVVSIRTILKKGAAMLSSCLATLTGAVWVLCCRWHPWYHHAGPSNEAPSSQT